VPLSKPTPEDIKKIHAEVNQIVNQRFLLITIAITVFGVVTAWIVPRTPPAPGSDVGGFVFVITMVLSTLLFSLFLLGHLLKGMLRVFTTYLAVTDSSNWEKDWKQFRQSPYLAYTKPQTIVFLILNALATGFPCILARVYSLHLAPCIGLVTSLGWGVLTEFLMFGMGLLNWWDRERRAEQQWKSLKV